MLKHVGIFEKKSVDLPPEWQSFRGFPSLGLRFLLQGKLDFREVDVDGRGVGDGVGGGDSVFAYDGRHVI